MFCLLCCRSLLEVPWRAESRLAEMFLSRMRYSCVRSLVREIANCAMYFSGFRSALYSFSHSLRCLLAFPDARIPSLSSVHQTKCARKRAWIFAADRFMTLMCLRPIAPRHTRWIFSTHFTKYLLRFFRRNALKFATSKSPIDSYLAM